MTSTPHGTVGLTDPVDVQRRDMNKLRDLLYSQREYVSLSFDGEEPFFDIKSLDFNYQPDGLFLVISSDTDTEHILSHGMVYSCPNSDDQDQQLMDCITSMQEDIKALHIQVNRLQAQVSR